MRLPLLAVTTSGPRAQAGLLLTGGSFEVLENSIPRQHSEWLHVALQQLLDNAHLKPEDLRGIAVDLGPGSFTGLRVGFQLAQSLSFANQTPVFSATSLAVLAAGLPGHVIAAKNAFRNMVYVAEFKDGALSSEIKAEDLAEFQIRLSRKSGCEVVGDAFGYYQSQGVSLPTAIREHPAAEDLANYALAAGPDFWTKDWKSLSPLYLRGSEAEEKAKMK